MSKIFLTGMSAPHASPSANSKSLSFAGVINKVLTDAGHDVTWASPSVYMTTESLDKFDAVIVGVSPITSVTANRVYGALNVIGRLWGSPKLHLLVDAPNASQIDVSLRSVFTNPENLTKPFFSFRKEHSNVLADQDIKTFLLSVVGLLLSGEWGSTIYPKLPWKSFDSVKLTPNAKKNLVGISLDSHLITDVVSSTEKAIKWCVDNPNADWTKSVVATLTVPNAPMKWNKGSSDLEVAEQISRSIGALIAPSKKDGTWWSYRYIQSLNAGIPIATDWQESRIIGEAWSVLASSIDTMSPSKRDLIAAAQYESYVANILTKEESLATLEQVLKISRSVN